ncbi:uncharacterized protein LOC133039341 [Cannabis sativa]|uniref:uncharacterized protein LOC133039341 n=1 Tax=Cannabis sativa TaxID=3483 RepID=UPI0029CA2A4C|nr:uncharacterized protein LOC133039341 [Cannabis sativa]
MNVAVAQYLEEIGFEKWVRSYFLGVRYNVITSNWAIAFLRSKVQQWYATRKEKAEKLTKTLSLEMEEDLALQFEKSRNLDVDTCGPYTFLFQCMRFSCPHACAATQQRSINMYALCSPYYTTEYWRSTYEGTIMPVGDEDDWELLDDIKNMTVGVRVEKQPVGQPKNQKVARIKSKRTACNGERIIIPRNCGKYGAKGHNRSTCTYRG